MGKLEDLREVLGGLKRKKASEYTPKLCPNCGSPNIKLSSSFDAYPKMYGITPSQYVCESCGYKGPTAVEPAEEEKRP
jgi:C4-type Zn-finger protein